VLAVRFGLLRLSQFHLPLKGCGWRDVRGIPPWGPQVFVGCASDTSILPWIRFSVKPQPLRVVQEFITPAFPSPYSNIGVVSRARFRYFSKILLISIALVFSGMRGIFGPRIDSKQKLS
jgi:hypothetical protein